MPLKPTYAKSEDVPEALRNHYVERDGVWNLDAEGMKTEDDFTRYKEATEKRIQEAKNKNHMTPEAVQKAVNDGIAAAMQKTPLKQEGGSQELADLQRKLAGVEEEQKKVSSERDVATGRT